MILVHAILLLQIVETRGNYVEKISYQSYLLQEKYSQALFYFTQYL